ncbi:MAG: LLM class flavin-dependent oxidoreductase [Oligoflexia bacterium]|nr:LLM class flavin-dependent oxidoreductase [Oligoflexia bacterium]
MKFDIFFSICQTPVDGYTPDEKTMFQNFFSQALLADELGASTAWVAETHLSCQIQKRNPQAVVPEFQGEIGLNTDLLQLAHVLFAKTKNINIGSAIMNIQSNGGPIAHAEAIRMALSLRGLEQNPRRLEIGFASGRFPFSNIPYGIHPRNTWEEAAWPVLKGKIFQEATEIFLRGIRGDIFASKDIREKILARSDFRSDQDWEKVLKAYGKNADQIKIDPYWNFDQIGIIPFEAPLEHLRLTIGCHDLATQIYANTFYPCGVFNLSITPTKQIEETHQAMMKHYHKDGGPWSRDLMPRTVLVFIDKDRKKARQKAQNALENYWKALEGTLDPAKIQNAVDNALVGDAEEINDEMQKRFHKDDRLMLWFDFNNHNNDEVCESMRLFFENINA